MLMNEVLSISAADKKERLIETWQLFIIITLLSLLTSLAFQKFLLTREVYYVLYGNQMEDYRIDDAINFMQKLQIWGYITTPLLLWLRLGFVTFLIQLPIIIRFTELPFKEIFRITSFAYLVFFSSEIVRFFYLYFLPTQAITQETLAFVPLSIINFINPENYSELIVIILSKINLFELLWGITIYIGLSKSGKLEKTDALLITLGVWLGILILNIALVFFIGAIK
jgi:hypothetical protein